MSLLESSLSELGGEGCGAARVCSMGSLNPTCTRTRLLTAGTAGPSPEPALTHPGGKVSPRRALGAGPLLWPEAQVFTSMRTIHSFSRCPL